MFRKLSLTVLLLALALVAAVAVAPAQADTDRITQGEAQALLRTIGGGAYVVGNNGVDQPVLFDEPFAEAAIMPFFSDGNHYCVLDYHAIVLLWASGGDSSFTYQDALGLNTIDNTFILDGVALETERTPIRRLLGTDFFGWEEGYTFSVGTVLAPDALAVGEHSLYYEATIGGVPIFAYTTTFTIDSAASATCQ